MRLTCDQLIFKALCVLDDVHAGTPAGPGLRFALAYLYAVGNGERWLFDEFWRAAIEPETGNLATDFGRRQGMTGAMNGICRSVGMERDDELIKALRRARQPTSSRPAPD